MKFRSCISHSTLAIIIFFGLVMNVQAQDVSLRKQIHSIIANKKAIVGFSMLHLENGDTLTANSNHHFPMQSVYKFHLALAVLNKVMKGELSMDQKIPVRKSDLLPDTWSPIRERYPEGGVNLPLHEIVSYTVSQSDNNGCDLLFRLIGGPEKVNSFIAGTGVCDIHIVATEEEMHKRWEVQYTNWSTPTAVTSLLEKFYHGEIIQGACYDSLWNMLCSTSTGPLRIKGLLPKGAVVAHKTGSSGQNEYGLTAATNDIGILCLPNGEHLAMAVFVSDSYEHNETNEKIIAELAKACWDYYSSK